MPKPERYAVFVVKEGRVDEPVRDNESGPRYTIRVAPQIPGWDEYTWVYLDASSVDRCPRNGDLVVLERDVAFNPTWGFRAVTEEEYAEEA